MHFIRRLFAESVLDCGPWQDCRLSAGCIHGQPLSSMMWTQVLSNMVDFGMEPQAALDAPRFRLEGVDSAIGPASVRTSKYGPWPCP